jgi:signal transduction histidine kinase
MRTITRWTILLLASFTAVLSVYGVQIYRREVAQFERDARRDLERIGWVLRTQLIDLLQSGDRAKARQLVKDADQALHDMAMRLIDLDGDSAPLSSSERAQLRRGVEVLHGAGHGAFPDETVLYLPVIAPGHAPLIIKLSQSNSEQTQYTRNTMFAILAATGVVLVVSILLVLSLSSRLIGQPMAQLIDHFRRIGEGDLSQVTVERSDEFGRMEHAVNAMCEKLAVSQEQVRRETEARIVAVEQARQADRLATVGRLASGVAHELGTPLNVVTGLATGISRGEYAGEEIPETAATIAAQAHRMTRIVQDVLSFVRRHRGTTELLDLWQIINGAVKLMEPMARKTGVAIVLSPGSPCIAEVDRDHLAQVLINLIQNAIQAQPGGGQVEISLAPENARPPGADSSEEKQWFRLNVRDHGQGMTAEVREQVFDPFFTTKDVGEGSGLGLSVVHGIVQEHGGWIEVDSEPGWGSQFSIYLPHPGAASGEDSAARG